MRRALLFVVVGAVVLATGGAFLATSGELKSPTVASSASATPQPSPVVAAETGEIAVLIAAVRPLESGETGAGFVVRSGEGCLLLTAAHVIEGALDVEVAASNRPPVIATNPMSDPAGRLDVAALRLAMAASSCPPPPSEAAIQRAVQGQNARLLVAIEGGQSVPMPVIATKVSEHEIVIKPASRMFAIEKGMSGSVLVMDGVPVAILSNVRPADGEATAIRLDYAAKALGPRVISLTVVTVGESAVDRQAILRTALKAGDAKTLSRFQPDPTVATVVNTLLDEADTLSGFAANFKDQIAQAWLAKLIQGGLDPNRLVKVGGRSRPLLYAVIKNNNVPLAVTLLNNRAYPYLYEDLWGQEYRNPYFLFPLELLDDLSASRVEKKSLVEAMVLAGLTVTEAEIPKSFYGNQQMTHVHETQRRITSELGVRIPVQNNLRNAARSPICKTPADEYDWCKLIARLPPAIQHKERGWHSELEYAALLKPLAIMDGHLYVMTYSPEGGNAQAGYGVMRVSKDADQLIWYRYMGGGAGMGHCEEIRGVENWRPDSATGGGDCWRRQIMLRGQKDGTYFVRGYPSVVYNIAR